VKNRFNRVEFPIRPGWVRIACGLAGLLALAVGNGRAEDASLADIALFEASVGEWEGIGVSFDIVNGELREPVTFRDRWEAKFSEEERLMEMRGTTRAGGRRIGYLWRFRWKPVEEKILGEFENSEGIASAVEVTAVAEGKRIRIRTPNEENENVNPVGMRMDIYLEEKDIVIESTILDAEGNETYRAAARYRKTE